MDLGNCNNELPNIHVLIEQQVKETPDRVAIETNTETLTYKELWEESGKVANSLTAKGIVSGDVVGIVMGRCKELIISVLGVMRAGGIFILIDSNAPIDRIHYMIEDSEAKLLLVKEIRNELNRDDTVSQLLISEILLEESNQESLLCRRNVEDTVYILYTSGSTGKPKGVQVVHRGLTNYITWAAGFYCKGEILNFPLFSAVSFDLTITSIFTPLITGAKIIVFEEDAIDLVRKVIRNKEIHVVKLTPSHFNMITEEDIKESNVRKFILGGESLKCSVTKRIHDWYQGNIEIYNEYGPTEATVGCMIYQYNPEKDKREVVPIGLPIQHTQIYILDDNRKPVAFGVPGEIYIGGYGLAKGYLNKEEQTKQSFIESPFRKGQMLYKTGDLAKVIPGKVIEYIGRKDEQVKLRGYRIELGEIENVILKQEGVKNAAVVIHEENGTKRLCAFLTASKPLDLAQIKDGIGRILPNYMVPDYMEVLEDMPITSNGKVDKALLKKKEINFNVQKYVMPTNDIEKKLVLLWQEMLHKDRVGVRDNFFDLGGNSLLIVQLCTRIVNELHIDCQVTELFAYPTIQDFVTYKYGAKPSEEYAKTQEKPDNGDVAIVGIGINMPDADNLQDLWKMLSKEHDFIGEFPNERKAQVIDYIKDQAMGEDFLQGAYLKDIDKFDAQFFGFSPVEADIMDPNQRIFLETCWKALEDAGYAGDALYGSNTGVFLGYGNEADYRKMVYKYNNESINAALAGTLPSITSSRISYYLNLTGPAVNFDTACSSSLVALHYACQSLYMKECEQALVGGVKIQLFPVSYGVDIGISSSDSRTKTFDNKANGTVGGEGSIALLIKPLEKALEQKDHIYAVIKGSAINQDGRSNGITAPNPIAQTKVIKQAWEKAHVNPETISYIEAHGTGTRLGDPIEINGITNAFRMYTDKRQFCAIGSIKSNIGHLDNVAGLAGVLKATLCLQHKKLLPNIHFDEPNEQISFIDSPVYVSKKYCDWEVEKDMPRRCGVSAFGMSGTNCHIIMEEAPEIAEDTTDNSDFCVLCISAESQYSFRRLVKKYTQMLQNVDSFHELKKICYTSNIGRGNYRYRMAVIFREGQDYRIDLNNDKDNSESNTIFYGEHVLVAGTKEHRSKFEITSEELMEYDDQADRYCKEFLEGKQEKEKLLIEIAKLYVKGCHIDWKAIIPEQRKVSLPTYPFKKERHWVNVPNQITYYTKKWVEDTAYLEMKESRTDEDKKFIAVIAYDNEICQNIIRDQLAKDYQVLPIYLAVQDKEERLEESILEQITDIDWRQVEKIVHICDLAEVKQASIMDFKKALLDSAMSLIFVTRYVANIVDNLNLYVVAKKGTSNQGSAILFSILRTISLEYTNISCRGFELDDMGSLGLLLQNDIENRKGELAVQVSQKKCYKHLITKAVIAHNKIPASLLTSDGVYVIWGGTGNIGLKVAEFLLEKVDGIHIALIGRTEVSSLGLQRREKLSKMLKEENNLKVYKADIADEKEISNCMQMLEREYKKINGLFFCAAEGVGGAGHPLENLSEADFWNGIKAKTAGIYLLERLTLQRKMDFMVLFSSVITSTGSYGDVAYSAANAYLDAFANRESKIAERVLTIDWPTWISTVKGIGSDSQKNLQMYQPITDKDALEKLWNILHSGLSGQFIIGEINHNPAILRNLDKAKCEFEESIIEELQDRVNLEHTESKQTWKTEQNVIVNLEGKEDNSYTETETIIGSVIGNVLGYQNVDVYRSFVEMGINSILFVQLQLKLEEKNIYVKEKDFYRYDTVYSLAAFLEGNRVEETKKDTASVNVKEKIYNDIFYKSCFYHSLFTLMRLEDRDIYPFYCNDIFCYEYQKEMLNIETLSEISEDEILMEQNIHVQKREIITTDELIAELKDNKKAVIWIDCYYEPIRPEMYHKEHLAHTLAITDYDEDTEEFSVIEHSGANNMDYKQCVLGKQDLELCIQGFTKYEFKDKGSCHYIMDFSSDKQAENVADYKKQYEQLWGTFKEQYAKSIGDLKNFVIDLGKRETLDEKDFQDMSSMVSNIAKYKAIDDYRNRIFEIEGEVPSITEEIYESWKRIRNSLVRMNLCKNYEEFDKNNFIEKLDSIAKLEMQLVGELGTKIY